MSWGVLPWVYPVWDSLGFLDLGGYFFPHFREVFNYYLLKYFLMAFLLSSSSGTPVIQILGHLTLSQRSLRLSSFLLILFSSLLHLFPLCFIYFLSAPLRCKKWKEKKSTIVTSWSSNWLQRGWSRELLGWKKLLISEYTNHNFTFFKIKLYMAIIAIINVDVGTA